MRYPAINWRGEVPEYGEGIYKDNGCALFPNCLECPFPKCIADSIPSLLIATKRAEARELAKRGMSKAEIAQRLSVSERTVRRYLAKIS